MNEAKTETLTLSNALNGHGLRPIEKQDLDKIIEGLEKLSTSLPLECEFEGWCNAATTLLDRYFDAQLGLRYQRIDPKILELKETLMAKGRKVEIPAFCCINFGDSIWEKKITREYEDLSLKVNAPPIPEDVKKKARESFAVFEEIIAMALRDPVVGPLMDINGFRGWNYEQGNVARVIIWRPKVEDIRVGVIDKDPALLLAHHKKSYKRLYLVATWNVENERPFEHIIREYGID